MKRSDEKYWRKVRRRAKQLKSDGCTGVPDFYLDCCYEHDIGYKTGKDLGGKSLTRAETDRRFRKCIQSRSWFGIFSPMSYWRWAAVRLLAKRSWRGTSPVVERRPVPEVRHDPMETR